MLKDCQFGYRAKHFTTHAQADFTTYATDGFKTNMGIIAIGLAFTNMAFYTDCNRSDLRDKTAKKEDSSGIAAGLVQNVYLLATSLDRLKEDNC